MMCAIKCIHAHVTINKKNKPGCETGGICGRLQQFNTNGPSKVTVIQHPADVDIYYKDPDTYVPLPPLVPGGSVQLSAQVTGYYLTEKANDQRVKWELDPGHSLPAELDGMVTVTSSGQIKLNKKAAPSTTYNIWIRATAKDTQYGAVYDTFPVAVRPKAKSLLTNYMGPLTYDSYVKYKNGKVSSVTLLTQDLPRTSAYENTIAITTIYFDTMDVDWDDIIVSSSNSKVVRAEYIGNDVHLTALSVGSSTITVKSADGVLKHSFPVKVINPIEGKHIFGSIAPMAEYIAQHRAK